VELLFENVNFSFDYIDGSTYGLFLGYIENKSESHFGVRQSIIEEQVPRKPLPYLYEVKQEPFEFETLLFRETEWDLDTRLTICRWLFQKQYKDFVSYDNPDIVYKVICIDSPSKILYGNQGGYIRLRWRSNAPWAYTKVYLDEFDLSLNTTSNISLENKSNIQNIYKPEIEVEIVDGTSFSIKNLTYKGEAVTFENLNVNETIYINGENKRVISSTGLYRYNNWNKKTLNLIYGKNNIEVTGKIKLLVRSQYPIAL